MKTNETRQELLRTLSELGEQCPDVRLGQMIANLATLARGPEVEAIWDAEDRELLEAARQQISHLQEAPPTAA
jgi:hypothetical protein